MSNLNVQTFINGEKHPFPPDMANAVFFDDFFQVMLAEQDLRISQNITENRIELSKDIGVNIQFIPYKDVTENVTVSIPIRYGEPVIVNIPGTNLVMLKDDKQGLRWVSRILSNPDVHNTFKIHSARNPDGDTAFYDDTVYFTFQDIFLVQYNREYNILEAVYQNYADVVDKKDVHFKLVSRVETYYCENEQCKPVNIHDTETDGVRARYKGIPVSRSPSCWGCVTQPLIQPRITSTGGGTTYSSSSHYVWIIVLGAVLLLIGFAVWIVKRSKHRRH
jgi:hypothetical protein